MSDKQKLEVKLAAAMELLGEVDQGMTVSKPTPYPKQTVQMAWTPVDWFKRRDALCSSEGVSV